MVVSVSHVGTTRTVYLCILAWKYRGNDRDTSNLPTPYRSDALGFVLGDPHIPCRRILD